MNRTTVFAVPIILAALGLSLLSPVVNGGEEKKARGNRSGQSVGYGQNKGANNSAQWSADPKRGWVRSDERQGIREQMHGSIHKSNNGKPEEKNKKEKR